MDSNMKAIEAIGDHFLVTGAGWFKCVAFRSVTLKDKYKPLLGNKNRPLFLVGRL